MKGISLVAVFAAAVVLSAPAQAGVSITIGEPGFYGRIELGDYPKPEVIYVEPVVIDKISVGVFEPPIYLRVPPGHAKNWDKHCGKYQACGHRTYFVQDHWYESVYAPAYRAKHGHGKPKHAGKSNGKGHGHGKDKHKD